MCAMHSRTARLEAALTAAFSPDLLRVRDDSTRHAGHAGVREGPGHAGPDGETHYAVLLVAAAFRGMPRVARSRAVHDVLGPEFAGGLHALALTLRTPEEHAAMAAQGRGQGVR